MFGGGSSIKGKGKNILLVYGGGSIKRNGLYDKVLEQLKTIDAHVVELSGVEPNPRLTTVRTGIELVHAHGIDFILAVGGGSTIDCTKAIAVGAKSDADIWDIITKKKQAKAALPFGTILTLAATGSEINAGSVITNWQTNEKVGWGSAYSYPVFSILDPTHNLEHAVSAIHDIPHGGGLAILFPQWMEHVLDVNIDRFKQLGSRVFDLKQGTESDRDFALRTIQSLRDFWTSIGAPNRLADYDINASSIEDMADRTVQLSETFGVFKSLTRDDAIAIYQASL